MSSNIVNSVAFLKTTWDFPEEIQALRIELNNMYIDVANGVNSRTLGLFAANRPSMNGEEWFLTGRRQQALRQIYPFTFTSSPFSIPHNINISQIAGFTRIWGTFVDAAGVWYPLPYVDTVAVASQVSVIVNASNIVITSPVTVPIRGTVVLEWLANS